MIECYRDSNGFNRVNPKDIHPLIASYLEQDIQDSSATCTELVSILNEVKYGNLTSWIGTGNAHTLTIDTSGVSIVNVWDDSFGLAKLSYDTFQECLEVWSRFIASFN